MESTLSIQINQNFPESFSSYTLEVENLFPGTLSSQSDFYQTKHDQSQAESPRSCSTFEDSNNQSLTGSPLLFNKDTNHGNEFDFSNLLEYLTLPALQYKETDDESMFDFCSSLEYVPLPVVEYIGDNEGLTQGVISKQTKKIKKEQMNQVKVDINKKTQRKLRIATKKAVSKTRGTSHRTL